MKNAIKTGVLDAWAVALGSAMVVAVVVTYFIDKNIPVIMQIILSVGGFAVAFAPRIARYYLEDKTVTVGPVKVEDK